MTHLALIYLGYDFFNGSVIAILKISEWYMFMGNALIYRALIMRT